MTLARGLAVQSQVIYALILRETRTRFGRHHLGYVWALLEPLMIIGIFGALMTFGLRHSVPPGMTMLSFLATGFIPYHFFTSVRSRVTGAARANRGLLYYPRVTPIDLIVARLLLEIATHLCVFLCVLTIDAVWYQHFSLDSIPTLLLGLALAAALGGGLGMTMSGLVAIFPSLDMLQGPLFRPLLFISGAWFTLNEISPQVRAVLVYNPVIHCTELVRDGWFRSYDARYADPWYAGSWAVILIFIGLTLERATRRMEEIA